MLDISLPCVLLATEMRDASVMLGFSAREDFLLCSNNAIYLCIFLLPGISERRIRSMVVVRLRV